MKIEIAESASDVAILSRVIRPDHANLPAAAARAWLKLAFDESDRLQMHELALKAQQGVLSKVEQVELENYRRVGRMLDMIHSKARRSLRDRGLAP